MSHLLSQHVHPVGLHAAPGRGARRRFPDSADPLAPPAEWRGELNLVVDSSQDIRDVGSPQIGRWLAEFGRMTAAMPATDQCEG